MPVDLVALLEAVSGLSGLIKVAKGHIGRTSGKKDEDNELITKTKENIEEMSKRLVMIGDFGWILNDYRELYEATLGLNTLGDMLFYNLGNIPSQSSQNATFFRDNIERSCRDLRRQYKMKLSNFLDKSQHLADSDQGAIEVGIRNLTQSIGGIDALLVQPQLDYVTLKNLIGNVVTASEDLVSMADNKIDMITKTLIKIGK